MPDQSVDMSLAHDGDDPSLRRFQLAQASSHGGISLVDQDSLCRRQLSRELLEETRFIPVEALQFLFDPLLPREESSNRRDEKADPFLERHLPPELPEDEPGVLVDQGHLAPDLTGGVRGRDHLVPHLDSVLTSDPDLELREEGERGKPAGSGQPIQEGVVPNRVEFEGDDVRPATEDFHPDRAGEVEHMADPEEGNHAMSLKGWISLTLLPADLRRVVRYFSPTVQTQDLVRYVDGSTVVVLQDRPDALFEETACGSDVDASPFRLLQRSSRRFQPVEGHQFLSRVESKPARTSTPERHRPGRGSRELKILAGARNRAQ
jgi:hypothetical protein